MFKAGRDYIERRLSWTDILSKMNKYIFGQCTLESLINFIDNEVQQFKRSSCDFLKIQRNDYYDLLMDLKENIRQEHITYKVINTISSNLEIYQLMNKIFDESCEESRSSLSFVKHNYRKNILKLNKIDRNHFLDENQLMVSERANIKRFDRI